MKAALIQQILKGKRNAYQAHLCGGEQCTHMCDG